MSGQRNWCPLKRLCKSVFNDINPEDDLKKVKKRIDKVKEQLKQGYDPFEGKYSVFSNQYSVGKKKKIKKMQNRRIGKSGEAMELPDFDVENLLMVGDCYYSSKNYSKAFKMYEKALILATGIFENAEYDGTTMKNAAIIGIIQCGRRLPKHVKAVNSYISKFFNDCIRSAELTLYLYKTKTNDVGRSEFDTKATFSILPTAHPATINFLKWEARRLTHSSGFVNSARLYEDYEKRTASIDFWTGCRHGSVLLALKKSEKAFNCFLKTLKHADEVFKRKTVLEVLDKTWAIGSPEDIEEYNSLKKRVAAADAILNSYDMMMLRKLVLANRWMNETGKNQLELSYAVAKNDKEKMAEILTNKFAKSTQYGHKKLLGEFLISRGKTNAAEKVFSKASTTKEEIIKKFLPHINFNHEKH